MTETTQTLSLGQQLKTAREALKLTVADIAQKTNLKKNHLEAFEEDVFILQNVPPAFVRGYVRNYVRFLRLPEELVGSVNYGEVTIPKEVKKVAAAPIPVKNHKSQARWVKGLTWLILLGAIGMTLAWWWQEHKKEQASSEQLVSNSVEIAPANDSANNANGVAIPVTQETPTPVQTEMAPAVQPTTEVVNTAKVEEIKVEPVKTETAVVEVPVTVTPATTEPAQPAAAESTPAAESVNVLQVPAATEQAEAAKTEEQPQAVGNDELRIEITNAQSWITVRGVKNKKLAEKLYNSGEVLTFNGNEQYRLTVGAPANVKIYYKGQEVPLKVDGRVARFKLPLAN